jgi:hypothetical protein
MVDQQPGNRCAWNRQSCDSSGIVPIELSDGREGVNAGSNWVFWPVRTEVLLEKSSKIVDERAVGAKFDCKNHSTLIGWLKSSRG